MEHTVHEHKQYIVTAKEDTAVTDVKSGLVLAVIPANTQGLIYTISDKITTSGECQVDPFVKAPALALGSGGGNSGGGSGTPGTPAGFGTPTASAVALDADAEPTIEVTASGSNTAKVFDFAFGIPRGEQGIQGIQGEQGIQGVQGEKGETGAAGANGYDLIYTSGKPSTFLSSHVHDMGELAADTDLSAVAFTVNATKAQTCELWLSLGATAYTVTWPAGLVWLDSVPALEAGKSYRFALRCEPSGKVVANLAYEYTA